MYEKESNFLIFLEGGGKLDKNKYLNTFISACTSVYLGKITRLVLIGVKLVSKKFFTEVKKKKTFYAQHTRIFRSFTRFSG
jgi:hypothetical protein